MGIVVYQPSRQLSSMGTPGAINGYQGMPVVVTKQFDQDKRMMGSNRGRQSSLKCPQGRAAEM
jgi:hypothetical protein